MKQGRLLRRWIGDKPPAEAAPAAFDTGAKSFCEAAAAATKGDFRSTSVAPATGKEAAFLRWCEERGVRRCAATAVAARAAIIAATRRSKSMSAPRAGPAPPSRARRRWR